ncbi:MAG: hypothetical protein ACOCQA_00275, partial [bacterium]
MINLNSLKCSINILIYLNLFLPVSTLLTTTILVELVDITEPLCRKIDPLKSDLFIYDTTGSEPYVTENKPKYINNIIRRLKNIYRND